MSSWDVVVVGAGAVPLAAQRHAVPAFPAISEVWLHLLEQYVPVKDLRHA